LNRLVVILIIFLGSGALHANAQTPLVIAWQAPVGPDGFGWNPNTYPSSTCAPPGMPPVTQFDCFIHAVLPHISGVGLIVPWGQIDDCAANGTTSNAPCVNDLSCDPVVAKNCYHWAWIDAAINDFLLSHPGGGSNTWSNGCVGGQACKIVLIVWLTQDSGNLNTYGNMPNTPLYVFTKAYANSLNSGAGCGTMCAQDVMICQSWTGGTDGAWGNLPPQLTDSSWSTGGGGGDYGLWNAYGYHILHNSGGMMVNSLPNNNFSGYPVMYELPIKTAAEAFITALAIHYSAACIFSGCSTTTGGNTVSGATIAPSIAYMRIGPSSGGENYPYCACSSSSGGAQCNQFYWPGPKGDFEGESQGYSDQGYLTTWPPGSGDGVGYVASLYQAIQSQEWDFPVDTPAHEGPASNMNIGYSDTEALLANTSGLGMGMQAASIGDLVTYTTQYFPSTLANWAVHFREFPSVPDHHLQTMNPGSPMQAAQFTITGGISPTGLVNCSPQDCSVFCTAPPWVYISGTSNPVFDGIWEVETSQTACGGSGSDQIQLVGTIPSGGSTGSSGGVVYSGAHLPLLLPFESQNCQGSFQTICSAELWEESLDWAYGTYTVSKTIGNTSSGDAPYQQAISNFLIGLPANTSGHNHMSTTAYQY